MRNYFFTTFILTSDKSLILILMSFENSNSKILMSIFTHLTFYSLHIRIECCYTAYHEYMYKTYTYDK
nr:MAG TPA: hypothetical protein [Bacteriophage sp.]